MDARRFAPPRAPAVAGDVTRRLIEPAAAIIAVIARDLPPVGDQQHVLCGVLDVGGRHAEPPQQAGDEVALFAQPRQGLEGRRRDRQGGARDARRGGAPWSAVGL
jgi:hypothetical protein